MNFEYVARCDGEAAFSGREQRVCAHRNGDGSRELPDDLRAAIAEYADD